MNEHAREWVAALRSGEYRQTRGTLRSGDEYCCLGVACDVYARAHPETSWVYLDEARRWRYDGFQTSLPPVVAEWLGFGNTVGGFGSTSANTYDTLSAKNDTGSTFAEIADVVEAEPVGLFSEGGRS